MDKKIFVTLFNSNYMSRGLTMYESLMNTMPEFMLYIVAFDDKAYIKLKELDLMNTVIISLPEFEDEELLRVKKERTSTEYCWTCASKSILYVIETFDVEECTYIDADLYFFSNPTCLIDELGNEDSVLITEHRYSDYCDQTKASGKYCVQFMTFKNNKQGMETLRWWCDRCIEWCYNRIEDGKLGDQKYVEQFNELFQGVHELDNIGGGVAPWNVSQYTFINENGKVYMRRINVDEKLPLIFYHFHSLEFFDKDVVHLSANLYKIPDTAISCIYKEYIRKTEMVCDKYGLQEEKGCWKCEQKYRDDNIDMLENGKNYYQYSLFV
jgi:hypothetical protein